MDEVLQRLGQRDMEGVFGRHELPIPIRNPGVTLPYCRCSSYRYGPWTGRPGPAASDASTTAGAGALRRHAGCGTAGRARRGSAGGYCSGRGRDGQSPGPRASLGLLWCRLGPADASQAVLGHSAKCAALHPTIGHLRGAEPSCRVVGRNARTGPWRAGTGSRRKAQASRSDKASDAVGGIGMRPRSARVSGWARHRTL